MNRVRVTTFNLLIVWLALVNSAPQRPQQQNDPTEDIVFVEDIVSVSNSEKDASVALITLSQPKSSEEHDSSSSSQQVTDVSDDLIFLGIRKESQTMETAQQVEHTSASADDDSSEQKEYEERQEPDDDEEGVATAPTVPVPPIDMSPFLALIPTTQVHAIVANYYRNDAKVRHAFAVFGNKGIGQLKEDVLRLREVQEFTRYLNASGLDFVKLVGTVLQAITPPSTLLVDSSSSQESANESTANSELTVTESNTNLMPRNVTEQLPSLQNMVESILNVLPQDQILATFFDKIESDQQFSKLIDNLGSKKFNKILKNLLNSVPLRKFIIELQNNHIDITRIAESLKSYFFLANF